MNGERTNIILKLDGKEYFCDATLPAYRDVRDEIPYIATSTWITGFWDSLKIHKGPSRLMLSIICMPMVTEHVLAMTSRQSYANYKRDISYQVLDVDGVVLDEFRLVGCHVTDGDLLEFHPDRVIRKS
jgi:hypothetical protein